MSVRMCRFISLLVVLWVELRPLAGVQGRAIMVEPPHRSSLWRFDYNTTINTRDDDLNCGGYDWQWRVNHGRCGVCGDRYRGSQDNDDKGKYSSGNIVRSYRDGYYINITFEVSANYLGFVEFRLCPRNTTDNPLNQSCFDRYPLWIDEAHGTRYYIGSRGGIYDIHIRLPGGLVCRKCVLQWTYKTGYRYNGEDECKCVGCGSQEQYINCADVEIHPQNGWLPDPADHRHPTTDDNVKATSTIVASHEVDTTDISPTPSTSTSTTTTTTPPEYRPPQTISISPTKSLHIIPSTPTDITPTKKSRHRSEILRDLSVDLIAPSFDSHLHLTKTPVLLTGSDITSTSIIPDVTHSPLTSVSKVFFSPPVIEPRIITTHTIGGIGKFIPRAARVNPLIQRGMATENPNTQFVSVSNILNRFFPQYVNPFLYSNLFKPVTKLKSIRTRMLLPVGCDVTHDEFRCVARGLYQQSPGINKWCEMNCRVDNCVWFMCDCFCEDKQKSQQPNCHAISGFAEVVGMDEWCTANCKVGYCPPNTCNVEECLQLNKET